MPRGDGSGPSGQGSRTGRGMGSCQPDNSQHSNFFGRSKGPGMGQGMKLGRIMPWSWKSNNINNAKEN